MTCQICAGRAHVQNTETGLWQRCSCLDRQDRDDRCRRAGMPESYWNKSLDDLVAVAPLLVTTKQTIATMVEKIKQNGLSGQFCLVGPPKSIRTIGFLLLRAALFRANGFSTRTDELSRSYLQDPERSDYLRARDSAALLLLAGVEYPNKMDRHVVETLLQDRDESRFGTIVTSSLGPADLIARYGEHTIWRQAVVLPSQEFG